MRPSDLMGTDSASSNQAQSPDPQSRVRTILQTIQDLDERVGDIARQFPEFSSSARKIRDELKSGMVKIVGNQSRGSEAPAPSIAV